MHQIIQITRKIFIVYIVGWHYKEVKNKEYILIIFNTFWFKILIKYILLIKIFSAVGQKTRKFSIYTAYDVKELKFCKIDL